MTARRRSSGALRVALHELVGALGEQQIAERVHGVVERPQLGDDRLTLRARECRQAGGAERDRAVVPARLSDARAPATAQPEPIGDVIRAQRLGHPRFAVAQLLQQCPRRGDRGDRRLDVALQLGDLLVKRLELLVGGPELAAEQVNARCGVCGHAVHRVQRALQLVHRAARRVDLALKALPRGLVLQRPAGLAAQPAGAR